MKLLTGQNIGQMWIFFKTLKQKCRESDIRWWKYKKDIKTKINRGEDKEKLDKLNNYMSEISPFIQQLKIIFDYMLSGIVVLMPIIIFLLCFLINYGKEI